MARGGTGEKQPYHHGDLRRALLEAAEAELTERGPEGFTLRSCAKRAGVSHAAPAHHFGDVTGLLSALAAEGYGRFVATLGARADEAGDDPRERMVALGIGYIEFARRNPALFRLMFTSRKPDYTQPDLVQNASAAFAQLVSGVAAVRGDEPLASPAGRHQVAAVWSIVQGMSELLLSGRLKFIANQSEDALQRDIAAILRSVIVGRD